MNYEKLKKHLPIEIIMTFLQLPNMSSPCQSYLIWENHSIFEHTWSLLAFLVIVKRCVGYFQGARFGTLNFVRDCSELVVALPMRHTAE